MKQQSDRTKLQELQERILARKGLVCCGPDFTVSLHGKGRAVYAGADCFGQREATLWEDVTYLSCTPRRIVAVLKDGTLRFSGREPVYATHRALFNARSVSCSATHTAVLLRNGRVTVDLFDRKGSITEEWPSVIDTVCGNGFVLGLTAQGRVVSAGDHRVQRHILSSWENVCGIFTDVEGETVYGITSDKKIISTRPLPFSVREWENVIFLAAHRRHIWAVTSAGELLSTDPAVRALEGQSFFVACAVSGDHAVALTRYGTVYATGNNAFGQCDTLSFGALFSHFDDLYLARKARLKETREAEQAYQRALTLAKRCGRLLAGGIRSTACVTADGHVLATGSYQRSGKWERVRAVACGDAHLAALCENGTVLLEGNLASDSQKMEEWTGVTSIVAGKYHTLGLTVDGRVLFCGRQDSIEKDVSAWTGISRLYSADTYALGIGYDGRLHIAGDPPFSRDEIREEWDHPVDVVLTATHMAAVYSNGRVLSTIRIPSSAKPGDGVCCDTGSWELIRSIAAGHDFTVGLCYGGRVVSVRRQGTAVCDTSTWRDIVAVDCGHHFAAGLTKDGRVLIAPVEHSQVSAEDVLPDTSNWKNVIALRCAPYHIIAVTDEGQILAGGSDSDRQCSATGRFVLFRDPASLNGRGRYRERLEQEIKSHEYAARRIREPDREEGILPFSQIAGGLREDTCSLLGRLAGSEEHLTVLDADGHAVTYVYATAERLTETGNELCPTRMAASSEGTVLISEDGRARERKLSAPGDPAEALPHKLGDSRFYPVRDVAFGARHRVVLLRDGTLRAFGENDRGQGDVGSWSRITAVACGTDHTVGLREDGTVVATGARHRESGSRARGVAHTPRANPCAVDGWQGVTSVSCAGDVTLGLCHDGTVKATGSSHYGQCNVSGWRGVVSVVTSGNHTVALFADGHVEAVGLNESGECRTEDWRRVVMIAVMPELTLGLRADGKVLAAGRHHAVLNTLEAVRAIACFGSRRQVFVMADGTLRIHNRGSEYLPEPLGEIRLFRSSVEDSILKRAVPHSISAVTARSLRDGFAIGMAHGITLGMRGGIHVSGTNENGQGDIQACQVAVQVSAGPFHSGALRANGLVYLTGRNTDGQCDYRALNRELDTVGVSVEESRSASVPALGETATAELPYAWKRVVCGYDHTAALRSDGRVYAIGANPDGRCDTRQWRDVIDMACGVRHTVASTAKGSCMATGDNRYGQCDLSLWKQITMVAAGEFHTVGLRADGRVEAAGDNRKGQCHVEDLRDIIAVACTPDATLCLRADGRVILRGGSGEHDKAVDALREIVAIHTCEHRIAALTVDRRLILIPSTV